MSIENDLFKEALIQIGTLYAESDLLTKDEAEALKAYDWSLFVDKANLNLAGSSAAEFFDDAIERYDEFEVSENINPVTFLSVPRLALRPFLSKAAQDLLDKVEIGGRLHQRKQPHRCPVCGGPISSSAVAGPQGSSGFKGRKAYCSICGSQWPIERIVCPTCSTTQSNKLHYYHEKEDPAHRLQTCDLCHDYNRVTFQIELKRPFSMEVEDIVLSKLDGMTDLLTESS